jgi:autotransporter passenger strand-loop-strand repeat protein
VASNLALGSGATEQVNVGGILVGGSVSSGALEYILGSGSNIVVNGGTMQMYGATTSTTVGGGGIEVVNSGTVDSAALITSGGDQIVLATASAVSATVATSGRQDILGSASATLVSGLNGRIVISSGGHATGDRIFSGGVETINSAGVTTGTFVSGIGGASATEVVNSGGVASNTSVGSGGRILVSGGTTSNAVVSSGGSELVFTGGTIAGVITLSGGTLEIKSGGSAGSSTIAFAGNGHLKLDNAPAFSNNARISGFGIPGDIDLMDITYNSATTSLNFVEAGSNLSGTLTVNDGTHIATLTLLGQYVTGQFHMANDGAGGTLVTDPPLDSSGHLAPSH